MAATLRPPQHPTQFPFIGSIVFIALSRFVVANDMVHEVKDAFVRRPHLVDSVPGFIRLEVLCAQEDPNEIWLLTYWSDEPHYRDWHRSHAYHAAHEGIPKGLKLVPRSAQIRFFDHVAS
jgi:heme-degrading monooxygenase HmoA